MLDKRQKRAIIGRLLTPVLIIIAALLYRPVSSLWSNDSSIQTSVTDGGKLTVTYMDVGQGDATLITKGDFHMLIDAGNNQKGSQVVQALKDEGIRQLDVVVGTHPDSDHIGGMDDVIENFEIETVYMPEAEKDTKTYQEVEEALEKKHLEAQMPQIGKEYRYADNVIVRFLSPSKQYPDANNNSLVIQTAYGKNRFLFMGDAEEQVEKDLLAKGYDLECDVLKAGHHGSASASSAAFLHRVDPVYAVISCGRDNAYGHPHAEVLATLEEEDVQIYRTDTMGTIRAVSDGRNVTLSTK